MADKDWHYPREKLAKEYMDEFTRFGCRALAIFSERQVGKTEFLTRDLAPEAMRRKHHPVYVDVWSARADPARAIANTLKGHTLAVEKPGRRGLTGLSLTAGLFSMGAKLDHLDKDRDAREPADTVDRLGYWASRLAKATGRQRVLARVVLQTQGLSELEHLVLRRVAGRGDPFSAEALAWYSEQAAFRAKAPTKSTIQYAVRTLRGRLLVESDLQTGRFRVSDERLERALRESADPHKSG